jgi:DNA polymerase
MIWSAYLGLPLSLENVGCVLKLEDQKMKEGKDLIRYFCTPCKPTKTNNGRTRNLPEHSPEKWETFKAYNKRDVEVELAIKQRLSKFPVPESIWEEYWLDQEINDRGIGLDMDLVNNAIRFDERSKDALITQMQDLTHLENPNSVQQMKQWLLENGVRTESLGKTDAAKLITENYDHPDISEALKLRLKLAKSSVKKYQAMQNAVCSDGRAHGMFQFYGANRSGRWAGRLIQLQNLPQNHMPDLAEARELLRTGDYQTMQMLYDDIPDTLSQLIRTAFIARPGYKFIVCDYSAIEARVLAYIAGETWRTEVFAKGGDIYCESAQKMFHVPVKKHGVNGHLRQKGKIAELALGYGGSIGALTSMGPLKWE